MRQKTQHVYELPVIMDGDDEAVTVPFDIENSNRPSASDSSFIRA